jgi:protein SCO1/2
MLRERKPMAKPASPPPRRIATALAGLAAVLILAAIAIVPRLMQMNETSAATIGGPFTLIDTTGKTVTDADYRGKLMLIYFGYTFCPDVCPTSLGTMAQALDQLTPAERAQVVPIFITVDPERDSFDQLAQYVGNFAPDLIGLTGSREQVSAVETAYHVYARKAEGSGPNYTMDHSSIFYLMGRDGQFVGHYASGAAPKDLAAGLRKAL